MAAVKNIIKGKIYVLGDDIDTDMIIPARYLTTMAPDILAKHAMEDLDSQQYPIPFLKKDGTCDFQIIVARNNFGCGSSREHAPIALHAAGIEAVIANSFARIYYRNSVNGGYILPLEAFDDLTTLLQTGDEIEINVSDYEVFSSRLKKNFQLKPFGPLLDIIEAGGLTAYNKKLLMLE